MRQAGALPLQLVFLPKTPIYYSSVSTGWFRSTPAQTNPQGLTTGSQIRLIKPLQFAWSVRGEATRTNGVAFGHVKS